MSRFRQRLQHPVIAWSVALATLYLAALPTVYGVYAADLTARHLWLRLPLTILWFLCAIGVLGVACDDATDFTACDGPAAHLVLASDLGVLLGDVIDPGE